MVTVSFLEDNFNHFVVLFFWQCCLMKTDVSLSFLLCCLLLAIADLQDNRVSVTSVLGGTSDNTGSGMARRLGTASVVS